MSNNKDEELIQLIQDVIAGNAEKKELCNKIYKEVYALAYPVYQDGEKSMTQAKKALIEVCKSVELIDLERNVHKQIATIVSVYFFTSAVSEHEEELKDSAITGRYEYSRIREDEELLSYMKKKAEAFRSPKAFDEQDEVFKSLSDIQMVLMELYAYEMQSVESIEDMTDIDSLYISQWIEQARSILLGYELSAEVEQDSQDEEVYIADEQEQPEQPEQEEDTVINYSDQYEPSDEYKEKKAVSGIYDKAANVSFRENSVTRFLKRIFPTLNLKARTFISWGMGCFVVIVLVSVLFVSVKAGKNNKKTAKDYDYQDMQYYTQPTTKQQSTSTEAATQPSSSTEATTNNETTTVNDDRTTRQNNDNITETTTERSYNRNNWTNTNETEPENSSEENTETESSSEERSSEENTETESSSEANTETESSSEANTEPESSSSSNDSGNGSDDTAN